MHEAHADLKNRMAPSPAQVAEAADVFARYPDAEYVFTPIAFPGKTYGFWQIGEQVEHPEGALAAVADGVDGVGFHEARNKAVEWGALHLGERPGTVGYTIHYPTQPGAPAEWAVFEDILHPLDILKFAAQDAAKEAS